MNVLIISHMYPSSFNNMSGIFVQKQVKELKKLGCNVTVISPVPWSGFPLNKLSSKWMKYYNIPKKDKIDGIDVYYPRYIEFPKNYFFDKSGLRMFNGIHKLVYELNKKNKFDLIHCHVALPDGYCGMLLNQNLHIPFVVTIHGQDFQYTINKSQKLKNTIFNVLDKANKTIVVSSKLKNIVKNEKFINKIEVINNGIDINDCCADKSYDVPSDIDILSVSNLVKTKGIDFNIMAIKKLVSKYKNLKYYIVGDGPEREHLESMISDYDLKQNVFLVGKLNHEKVMSYMKKCKIFSLPSWQEGFGVVYIEAMLNQKPVIGIKGEGIEDVIENMKNGILIDAKNTEQLTESIDLLLKDKDLYNNISREAKKCVIENFTWENTAFSILKLYEETVYNK